MFAARSQAAIASTRSVPPMWTDEGHFLESELDRILRNKQIQLTEEVYVGRIPSEPAVKATGEFDESKRARLQKFGFTSGLVDVISAVVDQVPTRYVVVDNSQSMQSEDGHVFCLKRRRFVNCSRWEEQTSMLKDVADVLGIAGAKTIFRFLNKTPGLSNTDFVVTDTASAKAFKDCLDSMIPRGVTEMTKLVLGIHEDIRKEESRLNRQGKKIAVVLTTDGVPTDVTGMRQGPDIKAEFEEAVTNLLQLPVCTVLRLCTDERKVVDYFNSLDCVPEPCFDVIEDWRQEALQVRKHNPWLNYRYQLHLLRTIGCPIKEFDLLDEAPLTEREMRRFVSMLLGMNPDTHQKDTIDEFLIAVEGFLERIKDQLDPIQGKPSAWLNVKVLRNCYTGRRLFRWPRNG